MTSTRAGSATALASAQALGPVVRARRKAQALRIDDAAGLLGVSVDLMSRLENGQGSVRLDKAMAVLDGLGLCLMVLPKDHAWAREALHASSAEGGTDGGTDGVADSAVIPAGGRG